MATKSFTDNKLIINNANAECFHNIMKTEKKVKLIKVAGHKTVKSKKAISKLLGI